MDPLILPFGGKSPKIHPSAFIAPGCKIIGDVEIGANASVWYNCVIRADVNHIRRSEEHTSELQSLMRISYAFFCLKKKNTDDTQNHDNAQPHHTPAPHI